MAKKKASSKSQSRKYWILSLDGGGIRGLIQALILEQIEKKTGKPISEMFDLITGTSTGGILALGLVIPDKTGKRKFTASDLVELYELRGKDIFSRTVWHKIHSGWGLREEKYPSNAVESVLQEYFGQTRLDQALTDVMVAAYAMENRTPFFFRSSRAQDKDQYGETYNFRMWEAARSTSAAPTYFEPYKLQSRDVEQDYYSLVDGGVFANNPAMCAFAEARRSVSVSRINMLSLGTGQLTRPFPHEVTTHWGLTEWVRPVLDVVFDGVSDSIEYQVKSILSSRYHRLQTMLTVDNDDLDDASQGNIRGLRLLAKQLIREQRDVIDRVCKQLA